VKAQYRNRLCRLVETSGDVAILADEQRELTVHLASDELVLDPTDKQVAAADNLTSWYKVEGREAEDLRAMLCGGWRTGAGQLSSTSFRTSRPSW
jgi:hypothetical protein